MTEKPKPEPSRPERKTKRVSPHTGEIGTLDVWARSAPIRLAGYEEDLAEAHILQGVD